MLKQLRRDRAWSQSDLAQIAGLSLRTVKRIESGSSASLRTIGRLARALDVSPATLMPLIQEEEL